MNRKYIQVVNSNCFQAGVGVVRSKGAIVSVDVDGNTETIPSSAYKELTGHILVPNSTKEVIIHGPEISAIKGDGGVMRVGMYEIGIGDQYANFEWYLNYSSGQVSTVAPPKIVSTVRFIRRLPCSQFSRLRRLTCHSPADG